MPMKLSIGLSKKIGLPDYGSLGASCNVELELDQALIGSDLDGFHDRVRRTFVACRQAVDDELARHRTAGANNESAEPANRPGHRRVGPMKTTMAAGTATGMATAMATEPIETAMAIVPAGNSSTTLSSWLVKSRASVSDGWSRWRRRCFPSRWPICRALMRPD